MILLKRINHLDGVSLVMGEYFDWVNVDKKEYICPSDFDLGNKLHETADSGNVFLGALYDLLSSDWKGDRIIFLGDEINITKKDTNPVLQKLSAERQAWGEAGYDADYVVDEYKCISGLYKAAEAEVRHEIEIMIESGDFSSNYYRVDPENPYEGLFFKSPKYFRYTVNHIRNEFFDLEKTKLTYTDKDGVLTARINPLPILMAFGSSAYDSYSGLWLGDPIEVTDDAPPVGYKDMSEAYVLR